MVRSFAELLATLKALSGPGWSRNATVTDVPFYGDWMAAHERSHVKQIARVVETIRT